MSAKCNISSYVIIRPESSTASNIKAVEELQFYLKKISGAEIPIKSDAEPPKDLEIAVGYTNRSANGQFDTSKLGDEGFVIESVGTKLFIAGSGVRGALYGVYTFLEKYLGCRFYSSDFEMIPSLDTLDIPFVKKDTQIPVFEYRDIDFVPSRLNNFQAKLKANGVYNNTPTEFGGKTEYVGGFVHTLNNLISHKEYFEDHPEYFGLNEDGTRQIGWGAQPCLTNPDVLNIVKDKVRAFLAQKPDAKIISISQPDNSAKQFPCMCENCKRIYEEEGAYSATMIRFVNEVAKEFEKDFPDLKFDTLAYHHTRSICKTPPAKNVVIRLCTIECCFSHPLGTCPDVYAMAGSTKTISEDIVDWGKVCDKIYVWDYTTNYVESVAFFPNFNVLLQNAKFFADNHVVGVYEEGNFFSQTCDFPELRSYIMAKILWNPYMSEEEYFGHIDDFLKGYYGNGWKFIRRYIDLVQEFVKDKHFGIHDRFAQTIYAHTVENLTDANTNGLTLSELKNYQNIDWEKYICYGTKITECELIEKGFELFDKAIRCATPKQAQRIQKLLLIPEFSRSYTLYDKYSLKAIEKNVSRLLDDLFITSDEAKTLSKSEQESLRGEIIKYVLDLYKDKYEQYNKKLFIKAFDFGITKIHEIMPQIEGLDDPKLDLSQTPDKWKPRT